MDLLRMLPLQENASWSADPRVEIVCRAVIGGVPCEAALRASSGDTWEVALTNGLPLSALLAEAFGLAVLPAGLPDLQWTRLSLEAHRPTGAFFVRGSLGGEGHIGLGGVNFKLDEARFSLFLPVLRGSRSASNASAQLYLRGTAEDQLASVFTLRRLEVTFNLARGQGWSVTGMLGAALFGCEFVLSAALVRRQSEEILAFTHPGDTPAPLFALPGVGTFHLDGLCLEVERRPESGGADSPGTPSFVLNGRGRLVTHGLLRIPFTRLISLLETRGFAHLARLLPWSAPLQSIHLVDPQGRLDEARLVSLMEAELGGDTLNERTRQVLSRVSAPASALPARLREYLNFEVPSSFSFHVSMSSQGPVELTLSPFAPETTPGEPSPPTPLKLLLPALDSAGAPELLGVKLHGISLGKLSPQLFFVRVDAEVDRFELLPLSLALEFTAAGSELPVPPERLQQTLSCRDLLAIIAPHTQAPLPVPFCGGELGIELRDLSGLELVSKWGLPRPGPSDQELLELAIPFQDFFLRPESLLDPQHPPRELNLELIAGPQYLRLPKHLGADLLSVQQGVTTLSSWHQVAGALNALKRLDIEAFASLLPLEQRIGLGGFLIGPLEFRARWLLSTLQELPWLIHNMDVLRAHTVAIHAVLGEMGRAALLLPTAEDRPRRSIVLLAHGSTPVAEGLRLNATIGAHTSRQQGSTVGVRLEGRLAQAFHLSLLGAASFQPGRGSALLQGSLALRLSHQPIIEGSFQGDHDALALEGRLALPGSAPQGPLQLRGSVTGTLRRDAFSLQGEATLTYGTHFRLANGIFELTPAGASYTVTWLGQKLRLTLTPQDSNISFQGQFERALAVPGVLRLSAHDDDMRGPEFLISGPSHQRLSVDGKLSILGMSFDGRLDLSRGNVRVDMGEQSLFGAYACRAVLEGRNLENLSGFLLTVTFTQRFTALEQALRETILKHLQAAQKARRATGHDWMRKPGAMPIELHDVTFSTRLGSAVWRRFQVEALIIINLPGEHRTSRQRFEVDLKDLMQSALALARQLQLVPA